MAGRLDVSSLLHLCRLHCCLTGVSSVRTDASCLSVDRLVKNSPGLRFYEFFPLPAGCGAYQSFMLVIAEVRRDGCPGYEIIDALPQ